MYYPHSNAIQQKHDDTKLSINPWTLPLQYGRVDYLKTETEEFSDQEPEDTPHENMSGDDTQSETFDDVANMEAKVVSHLRFFINVNKTYL